MEATAGEAQARTRPPEKKPKETAAAAETCGEKEGAASSI